MNWANFSSLIYVKIVFAVVLLSKSMQILFVGGVIHKQIKQIKQIKLY